MDVLLTAVRLLSGILVLTAVVLVAGHLYRRIRAAATPLRKDIRRLDFALSVFELSPSETNRTVCLELAQRLLTRHLRPSDVAREGRQVALHLNHRDELSVLHFQGSR